MAPRNHRTGISMETLWADTTYTRARLNGDENAQDFASLVDPLLADIKETRLGQEQAWLKEIEAQATCDYVNGLLDNLVYEAADTMVFTIREGRDSARVKRYLKQSPSAIVRLALRTEVEEVRSWSNSLATEPEEALKQLAPRFAALVEKADAVLAAQTSAANARLDHRVRVIDSLVAKVNAARFKLYGQLVGRAAERQLGKSWPDGFFKTEHRQAAGGETPERPVDPGYTD